MSVKTLGVMLLTYNRFDYAVKTLESTLKNLVLHNQLKLHIHIASDGDEPDYINKLVAIARDGLGVSSYTMSNSDRQGYGANYNRATQVVHAHCEYVLALEDDWELLRPFDPYILIQDMEQLEIGCARLGYIGYTQELRGTLKSGEKCGHWLIFDPTSAEPHVFAGHPRIESRAWSRKVGPWPENLLPGDTEFHVAHISDARMGVAWPLSLVKPEGNLYAHIGAERSY